MKELGRYPTNRFVLIFSTSRFFSSNQPETWNFERKK